MASGKPTCSTLNFARHVGSQMCKRPVSTPDINSTRVVWTCLRLPDPDAGCDAPPLRFLLSLLEILPIVFPTSPWELSSPNMTNVTVVQSVSGPAIPRRSRFAPNQPASEMTCIDFLTHLLHCFIQISPAWLEPQTKQHHTFHHTPCSKEKQFPNIHGTHRPSWGATYGLNRL